MSALGADFSSIHALGWSLIHFLWQGAVIGLLFAMAKSVLPKEQSDARYAIGLIALVALVLCPLVTFALLWTPGALGVAEAGSAELAASASSLPSITFGVAEDSGSWLPLLVVGWLSGVIAMFWRGMHQWRALERIANRLAWRQVEIEEMLGQVARRFGTLPAARVLVSACIDTPTLIGWFKPVILLPVAVVTGFPRHQLELILAHELGHLRRYDHLVNLGQAIIETLLFYHPVVHWISRDVRHEREICCDNLVLRLTESEPREYARTLAALEHVRQLSPQLAVAASGGMLLDRVRRIVGATGSRKHNRRSMLGVWLVAAGCSLLLPAIMYLSDSASETASDSFEVVSAIEQDIAKPPMDLPLAPSSFATLRFADMPVVVADPTAAVQQVIAVANPQAGSLHIDDQLEQPRDVVAASVVPSELPLAAPPLGPEVADLEVETARVEIAAEKVAITETVSPQLVRKISPNFPDNGFGSPHSKVDFEFSIDRGGNVRNIRVVSGEARGAFAVAARDALRQWRFDPSTVADRSGEKFRQSFEFVSKSYVASDDAEGHCTPPTGSHVCRPGRGYGALKAEQSSKTMIARAADLEDETEICTPPTGSHLCRGGAVASLALRDEGDKATSSHTVILSGGSN